MEWIIRGHTLPGRDCVTSGGTYENVHVGVQRKAEVIELKPGDAKTVEWRMEIDVVTGKDGARDFKGPHVQGKRGDRFLYLSWNTVDKDGALTGFRRAKLMLEAIDATLLARAQKGKALVGELSLTMADGTPTCAAVRPPRIVWSVE